MVFDIETIPDVYSGALLNNMKNQSKREIAEAMYQQQRQKTGHSFLPHHFQHIIAISLVLRQGDSVKVWSLGDGHSTEQELLERFFLGVSKFIPTLVSWNGTGFDLPVIHYRSLLHGVTSKHYWETGDNEQSFRWNNYLSRYHYRHIDLMDILASYQMRANAPLHEIATLLGFPGKMGMDGQEVWETYCTGDIESIRNYCETDVLNTYLIFLRFQLIRGQLTPEQYKNETILLREVLTHANAPSHLKLFAKHWKIENTEINNSTELF